ncbi:MAG TPA: amidohydrolase family protein, partial [Candidatus Cloacimonadota bacterium]|nr:amidohydrolase family protein [Candidatus Cloacimonadota bacterium]
MRNILCNIINPVAVDTAEFLPRHVISVNGTRIQSITPLESFQGDYEDYSSDIALPGFIDLHVHLSQYRIRGRYFPALLPWLQQSVFPEESKSQDPGYALKLSEDFFNALLRAGTTCSVIYTAPYREAADAAFETA